MTSAQAHRFSKQIQVSFIRCTFLSIIAIAAISCTSNSRAIKLYDEHIIISIPKDWTQDETDKNQITSSYGDVIMTVDLFIKSGGQHADFSQAVHDSIDKEIWTEVAQQSIKYRSKYTVDYFIFSDGVNERQSTIFAISKDNYFLSINFVSSIKNFERDIKSIENIVSSIKIE